LAELIITLQKTLMNFLETLRYFIFWQIDYLKKSQIGNHYREIEFLLNNSDSNKVKEIQEKLLDSLLNHAVSTTKFYNEFIRFSGLESFPVINKSIIRNSLDSFRSDKFKLASLLPLVTSGSTGTPFMTYHDKNKRLRNSADTIYFAHKAGYEIGHRLIYLKIWAAKKMRSKFDYWLQNIVPVDVIQLNNQGIESLIKKLERDGSNFSILGYASALELISKYLNLQKLTPVKARVRSIIAISESLNDYTKIMLKKYFGVPVVSRYSNLENGIIAQQEVNTSSRFLINTASYYVEILGMDSENPVKEGELGRIVLTDLFNYAMPLIRYDTGDVGAIVTDKDNPSRRFFSRIEGRKLDLLYDTKGDLISSYIMYKNMWQYTEIDQYQLIQENAKRYTFKINTKNNFKKEMQLIKEFKSFLGEDADFRIEYVNEIPLLASGKRRIIVNNFYK
jgi:phenylacetate-CoA ligase